MVGIYCIKNAVTGNVYIGQSIHIEIRKREHFSALKSNNHYNQYLQCAFNKYGIENFEFSVIEECSQEDLDEREIYWINQFGGYRSNKLYNLVEGGGNVIGENNPNYGKHWSEQWRAEQSERMKNYFSNPLNHPMYGKHHSDEAKEHISKSLTGRSQSEDINKKRSDTLKQHFKDGMVPSMLGKHHSEETKQLLRDISSKHRHSKEVKSKLSKLNTGEGNPMYGKHHSDEVRKQLSESHKGIKNHMYGKIRITNGQINKVWPKDKPIPEGFRPGMKPRNKH